MESSYLLVVVTVKGWIQVSGEFILTCSGHNEVMDTGEWRVHTYLK